MPFTLAHPAAVLPIWAGGKPRLRLAALVLGAVTPDFEYFLHLNTVGRYAHSLPGLFFVCLPAGWLSLWLFDRFGRQGIASLLPTTWQLPAPPTSPNRVLPTSVALLLGAATHVIWDAFTHASGWGVVLLPQLADPVFTSPSTIPWFKVLQHGSTLLGLAVLAGACWKWMRRQPPVPILELLRRTVVPGVVLATAGVLNGLRFLPTSFQQFVVSGGVAVTLTLGLGLVLLGLFKAPSRASVG